MGKGRLEAFSDGVIAVIITIMVLDLKAPRGAEVSALVPVLPGFLTYLLSFVLTAIYWNNHHHMFLAVKRVNGAILWANLHLLFWLSIVPFVTAWASANRFAPIPTALYGFVLLLCGVAYTILQWTIVASQGPASILRSALGNDFKGKVSVALYFVGVILAVLRMPILASICYVAVAITWLIPDRRIERVLVTNLGAEGGAAVSLGTEHSGEPRRVATNDAIEQIRDLSETNL